MERYGPAYPKLQRILERQGGAPRWGHDYLPANFAGDIGAPRDTRPAQLYDPVTDRSIQAQAKTERPFVLLALHRRPLLFELHEQKVLWFNPGPHPLHGHPAARGLDLPMLRGTLAIAEEMGALKRHATVRAPADHPTHPHQIFPYPYIGDLLLFLLDEVGPYCVNWSIKYSLADFHRTFQSRMRPTTDDDRKAAEFRHELERRYFQDGTIPTHCLVPPMIDTDLRINLKDLHYWWARTPENQRAHAVQDEMIDWLRDELPRVRIQFDLAKDAATRFGISVHDAKWVLKKAIFDRQLRVDLFRTVLDNLPLFPEREDPFVRYATWFSRSVT